MNPQVDNPNSTGLLFEQPDKPTQLTQQYTQVPEHSHYAVHSGLGDGHAAAQLPFSELAAWGDGVDVGFESEM